MNQANHTFHIPVMGTGFSIDSPLKVARYGISSVISLVDDTLIEEMRKFYCLQNQEAYSPITRDEEDFRARRITAYLDLLDKLIKKQFAALKSSAFETGSEITKYFELLPDFSPLKILYDKMMSTKDPKEKDQLQMKLRNGIKPGRIDVNIMTRLDRPNFDKNGKELPVEFSDALSAFRGYAQSTLESAIIFSAGFNRRLYSYVENFKDFYADASGFIKKKIVLKVSDYRSSITQGKFFVKKGLWVSEFRVESGLNCGGHAFPSNGQLLGPILHEFKEKRQHLIETLHKIYTQARKLKDNIVFKNPLKLCVTAQGGIGTYAEDRMIQEYYQVDSTGWATPFLLVPEVTNVDEDTLKKLYEAKEDDLYISDVSPMDVPFNNLKDSPSDLEQKRTVREGNPGSFCPKGHLCFNTEFTKRPICTASKVYKKLKLDSLQKMNLSREEFERQYSQIICKSCLCHDLGASVLIKNKLTKPTERYTPAICPGPNLAYFSKVMTLKEMVGHIYGRINMLDETYRPHMFIKEIQMYFHHLTKEIHKCIGPLTQQQVKYFKTFKENLLNGIDYYRKLLSKLSMESQEIKNHMIEELKNFKTRLEELPPQMELPVHFSKTSDDVEISSYKK